MKHPLPSIPFVSLITALGLLTASGLIAVAHGATVTNSYSGDQTVNANLADPGGGDILAVRVVSGTVTFAGNNTYSGGTDIQGGILQVNTNNGLGSGAVTVAGNARLNLNCPLFQNDVSLADGSTLGTPTWVDNITVTNGTLSISGTVTFINGGTTAGGHGMLFIDDVITGSGGLLLKGDPAMNYHKPMYLRRANEFTGPTRLAEYAQIAITHPDALGTSPGDISISNTTQYSWLRLQDGATTLNTNKSLTVGTNGLLYVAGGVALTNTVRLEGGTYSFYGGGAAKYQRGTMILADNTTSKIDANGDWSSGEWRQTGQITGAGGLKIWGAGTYSSYIYFEGSNTCNGLFDISGGNVRIANDWALGTGPVLLNPASSITLTRNAVIPSQFRGTGSIITGANVLTCPGSLAPGNDSIGTLTAEDLDFRGTYYWEFNESTNDLVNATTLAFGGAPPVLDVKWVGAGPAPNGEFPIMTYSGPDPVNTQWIVRCRSSQIGKVRVDAASKRLMVKLASAGTVVFFK